MYDHAMISWIHYGSIMKNIINHNSRRLLSTGFSISAGFIHNNALKNYLEKM